MGFFRIKRIKGKEYVYFVENSWEKKGSRQKVKGYLGKAYRLNLQKNVGFNEFLKTENMIEYLKNNEKIQVIQDLIKWEMFKHGVSDNDFLINLKNCSIKKNNRSVVLLINEGFLCEQTIKSLVEFKADGIEENVGYNYARKFVDAGIKVPQEVFIGLYSKLI